MNSYQAKRLRLQLFRERRSRELSEKTSFRMPTHWTQLLMLEEAIHTNGARRARLKLWYAQAEVCMERKAAADDSLCCSFCGKQSVGKLIPSPFARASICDQCIAVSAGIIEDDRLAFSRQFLQGYRIRLPTSIPRASTCLAAIGSGGKLGA